MDLNWREKHKSIMLLTQDTTLYLTPFKISNRVSRFTSKRRHSQMDIGKGKCWKLSGSTLPIQNPSRRNPFRGRDLLSLFSTTFESPTPTVQFLQVPLRRNYTSYTTIIWRGNRAKPSVAPSSSSWAYRRQSASKESPRRTSLRRAHFWKSYQGKNIF